MGVRQDDWSRWGTVMIKGNKHRVRGDQMGLTMGFIVFETTWNPGDLTSREKFILDR